MRRLRNSTWRGAHNAPHCGTDSVPGGRKLGRNPSRGHLYRRCQSESSRLFPQTELRLTCHRCTVLVDTPSSSRAARRATRGKQEQRHRSWLFLVLSPRSSTFPLISRLLRVECALVFPLNNYPSESYSRAPVTRQITSPTSSATSRAPSGPIATPTGRP